MSDPSTSAMLHGPGGLLSTPGLGSRRRKRKWGTRLKDKQIKGNLYRSDVGRFSAGNGPPSAATAKKPRAAKKPKKIAQTPDEKRAARAAEQAQNRAKVLSEMNIAPDGQSALGDLADGQQPRDPSAIERGGFVEAGLVEQASDGSYRMTASGRAALAAAASGDAGRAGDTISSARDRLSTRQGKQQAAAARREAVAARRVEAAKKKPAKASAGGSKQPEKPAAAPATAPKPKRATRQSAPSVGAVGGGSNSPKPKPAAPKEPAAAKPTISPALRDAASAVSTGDNVTDVQLQQLVTNGLVRLNKDGEPILTAAGQRATMKAAGGAHTGVMVALYPDSAAAKQIVAQKGVTEPIDDLHLTLAFMGDSTETALSTNKDKVIAAVKQWATEKGQPLEGTINGLGRFFHSEDDDTNAVFVSPDVPGLPELRQSLVDWIEQSGFDYAQNHGFTPHITVAYVPLDVPTPPIRVESPITFDHVTLAWGDERYDYPLGMLAKPTEKAFTVYKDHTGASRWIARTTTAYRDRDGEIISEAALDADSQRMTATKQFGPLRYWHVGAPDPLSDATPWGPGLDIGDCDYSVVIGRTRIESGTFRSPGIAQKMAAAADRHEMSPGFFHPLDQPDAGGVFDSIRTFERSIVPTRYGRGSNLFTGFTVKEFRMELAEMERRFKAMYRELGLTPEQGMEVGQQLVATEKTAQAQGIAFKDSELPDVTINGVVYKAFPPKADDTAAPIEEVKADAPPMVDETVVDDAPMDEQPEGDYIGDMSWDEFAAKLSELLAPVLKMQDMLKSIGDTHAELKTMYGGVAQKDAGALAEIASLKARLAEIEGDQPATILPDEVAEALKSAGPAKPIEPERKQIESTPERPWAGWGAKTFPELYAQNGENA